MNAAGSNKSFRFGMVRCGCPRFHRIGGKRNGDFTIGNDCRAPVSSRHQSCGEDREQHSWCRRLPACAGAGNRSRGPGQRSARPGVARHDRNQHQRHAAFSTKHGGRYGRPFLQCSATSLRGRETADDRSAAGGRSRPASARRAGASRRFARLISSGRSPGPGAPPAGFPHASIRTTVAGRVTAPGERTAFPAI